MSPSPGGQTREYVVSGGASGIGAALTSLLRAAWRRTAPKRLAATLEQSLSEAGSMSNCITRLVGHAASPNIRIHMPEWSRG